ncbi:MAG: hypothetical protein ACRDRU_17570 [Pseudonocardiaceae bacterium]
MTDVPEQHNRLRARGPAATTPRIVPEAPHGTAAGFFMMGCRCMACLHAKNATTPPIGPDGAATGESGTPKGGETQAH